MYARFAVIKNTYQDSIKLMVTTTSLRALPEILQAAVVMGSEANLALLHQSGLHFDGSTPVGPQDIVVAVGGNTSAAVDAAIAVATRLISEKSTSEVSLSQEQPVRSLRSAVRRLDNANLAIISVPGVYAAAEAHKALSAGLNVMMFSDNVSIEDEVALKVRAREHGLLMMGPDCGTAIIRGVPLCFANNVRRGPIGIVGASGTGTQEVSVLIDRLGSGVSHAIGTGGRDLNDDVGGITMLMGIDALEHDPSTEIIVIISKPPGKVTAGKILARIEQCSKPVVVAFLGANSTERVATKTIWADTLEETAAKAVAIAQGREAHSILHAFPRVGLESTVQSEVHKLSARQAYVRGLYSGGTLAQEADILLAKKLGVVYSNISKHPELRLADARKSTEHCLIDFGDDEFTVGRPHPMIDPSYRAERLVQEHGDPSVAVILCDIVLGYGAHANPAQAIADSLERARAASGRYVSVVASVCGTDKDPQRRSHQEALLRQAGVVVLPSNAYAAEVAGAIAATRKQGGLPQ